MHVLLVGPDLESNLSLGYLASSLRQAGHTARVVAFNDWEDADRSGPARLVGGVPTAYIMGSRGCVRRCDCCCITTLHDLAPGPRFRRRDPDCVVAELAYLYRQRGVRQFVFHDDNFLVPNPNDNQQRLGRYQRASRCPPAARHRPGDEVRPARSRSRIPGDAARDGTAAHLPQT